MVLLHIRLNGSNYKTTVNLSHEIKTSMLTLKNVNVLKANAGDYTSGVYKVYIPFLSTEIISSSGESHILPVPNDPEKKFVNTYYNTKLRGENIVEKFDVKVYDESLNASTAFTSMDLFFEYESDNLLY